jgi:ABC-type Fe3+ transport system permease subunit
MTTDRESAARRPRPAARRNGVSVIFAISAAAIALVGGVVLGYSVRGEPPPASLITEERDVPVVTVTVEAPQP